ncbi:MAG: hypothetical protein ACJ8FY_29230 [Gemmataceae bacterium]
MARFNPAKTFNQIRADSQREKKAAEMVRQQKQEQWAAYGRRSAALNHLMNLFPREVAEYALDVQKATGLMVEYAQTLPAKWVKACVKFVSHRLADSAAEGRLGTRDVRFKEVLLNLLLFAKAGNDAKVAEIFGEAARAYPSDLESFRHYLVNWLADKVVDTWPPLPAELEEPREASEAEVRLSEGSTVASPEEWLPATEAVECAEKSGHPVGLKWLTQDAHKHGVRIRPRQQPGRHRKEVEWTSLILFLTKHAQRKMELDDGVSDRLQKARAAKQQGRSLEELS